MKRSPALVLPLLVVVLNTPAQPASAHDWHSECSLMCGADRAEFERARTMAKLDCAELAASVAAQNWQMNQWIYAEYHRPLRGRPVILQPPGRPLALPSSPLPQ